MAATADAAGGAETLQLIGPAATASFGRLSVSRRIAELIPAPVATARAGPGPGSRR